MPDKQRVMPDVIRHLRNDEGGQARNDGRNVMPDVIRHLRNDGKK